MWDRLRQNGVRNVPRNPPSCFVVFDFEAKLTKLQAGDIPTSGNLNYSHAHVPLSCAIFPAQPQWTMDEDTCLSGVETTMRAGLQQSREEEPMSTDQEEEPEDDAVLEALAELASSSPTDAALSRSSSPRVSENDELDVSLPTLSSPDISDDELDEVARVPTPVNPTVVGDHEYASLCEPPQPSQREQQQQHQQQEQPHPPDASPTRKTEVILVEGGFYMENTGNLDNFIETFYETLCAQSTIAYKMKQERFAHLIQQLQLMVVSKQTYLDTARTPKQVKYRTKLLNRAQRLLTSFDSYLRQLNVLSFNGA